MANSSNEKVFNVLAYIGILFLVGLIADGQNPKVRFHVNQGLVLFLSELILGIVCSIIGVKIGSIFGDRYKARAEFFGGLVLIVMGLKILIEHFLG